MELALLVAFLAAELGRLAVAELGRLAVAELERLAAVDREGDWLVPFLAVPFLEFEPDPLAPFLDVERELALPVRFACVRPRLLPRRD